MGRAERLRPLSIILVATVLASGAPRLLAQTFNYAEALQKSLFFYEAQISGPKPSWSRVTWRGDSAMQDGADVGRNLTGGWFDAGDHVKFGFAMASSATMLAWSGVAYRNSFAAQGQLPHLLNNLRFVNDYFIRAHTAPNELWGQVGTGGSDHSFWGSAEVMHLRTTRPSAQITLSCGGSDLAAETAAAMAASSIVFRPTDPAYADTLLTHARQLFDFAEATHPSFYVDCIPDAAGFYNSHFGSPNDEMAWAAIWLHRATNEPAFLQRARQLYPTMCKETGTSTPCFTWSQSWNDKHFGVYVLMAQVTGEQAFRVDVQRWLDYWTVGAGRTTRTTPGGLMFVDGFGPIRYATNAAFLALVYADLIGPSDPLFTRYHDFAKRQVDYALGANPRNSSYVVGFGNNPPLSPHHRTTHGTWNNSPTAEPNPSRHTLYGGLVGGPNSNDTWADDRSDFQRTEVATDFNAGFTGALARLAQEFGGNPLPNFPVAEAPDDEIFIDAQINVQGQNFTEIRALLTNQSAWPSRILSQGTFRYYFTLEPGVTPAQVTLQGNFNQCGSGNLTGPFLFSGNTYFVIVSCVGTNIYPGGQDVFRREVQFRIAVPANVPGNWDTSNDYSFQGLTSGSFTRTRRIVIFDNGVRIWGDEPGASTGFTLSAAPPSVGVAQGGTATSTIAVARTGGFAGAVTLAATGLPTGVTAAFSVNPVAGASSLVSFAAASGAAAGTFPVTITGTAAGQTSQSTSIMLTVAPGVGFTLSATPPSVSVTQGSTAASTINIARTGGFAGAVTLAATGLPTGVTATFNANPATGATSTLTFTAAATATQGLATVTVTGTAAGVANQATSISLTVSPSGGGGVVTPTALVNSNTPFFNEEALRVDNTATLTALSITVVIQRTTGVSFSGQFNTVGGQFTQTSSSTAAAVTYLWTLNSGQTLGGGTNRLFAAQTSGSGTTHPTAGDTWSLTYTSSGQTVTQSGNFGGTSQAGFTVFATPPNVSVTQGSTAVTTINIARTGGFAGGVTLVATGLPTGVTATFSTNPATGATSTLTFTAAATATLGPATVTVTGTAAGVANQTTSISLTVNPAAGFTLSATPPSVSVAQGSTAATTINIARTGGFAGGVTLAATGLPTGVTATFSTNPATGATSTLTFTAAATATLGPATVTVTGTAAGVPNQTTSISLTVNPAAGFTLSATPPSVSVTQGSTAATAINIVRTGGFAGGVTLAATGLPTGVTATFSTNPATGATSTLTFTAAATATLGPATVTVTGTATGVPNQTTSISVTVNPAAGFTLSATPPSMSVTQGTTAATAINIARTGGFAGGVTLAATGLPTGVTATFTTNPATGATSTLTFTAAATATLGPATVTVTGTATGVPNQATSISLTVSPPSGGVVTPAALVNSNTPFFNEEALRVDNTAALTALSITVVIQRTTGVSFSGQFNTVGGPFAQTSSSTAAAVTYLWTLTAGQTLGAGTNRLFVAQTSGSGTTHPTAGDTWSLTYTSGGQSFTQSGNFGGTSQAGFTVSATPPNVSVTPGSTAVTTINIARTGGFAGGVTLAATGLPTGVTATFSASPATGATSTLTFTAAATAAPGPAAVTVTGTSTGVPNQTTSIGLTVNAGAGFTLSAAPGVTVTQGSTAASTINVARTGGFADAVTLAAAGLPSGVTATFSANPATGATSTLTFAAAATATLGPATVTVTGTATGVPDQTISISLTVNPPLTVNGYTQRFLDMWGDLHGNNGYFHPANVPYHSVETLMVEAPDHGHETTSEAFSFWAWLEVMYGHVTGNWTPLQQMFDSMEANIIPTPADQPTNSFYNPGDPADYAPEFDTPNGYPAPIDANLDTGSDPIGAGLQSTYGTPNVYGMHWIIDVDNFYGYGRRGDGVSQPSYMNTFQRGPQESTWETVPHPSWEDFGSGGSNSAGFLPLFITGPTPARQWRYTDAPDADARLIQAMYWANQFAPGNPTVTSLSAKAARMGDYLRYAFFDKYFKTMGCTSPQCPAGNGYNAAHYLLSWYYAWGGPIPPEGGWSFRIGSSHNHFGYQNPMAAHALVNTPALRPQAPNAVTDWATSLDRQLQFYRWLQSTNGGIAGGATNSLGGRYLAPPAGTATFYGMFYQENPVYLDPGSNTWFGFQVWSMERVAEYYHETGNAQAKLVLDKWVPWAMANTRLPADGTFQVPSTLAWNGQPSLNWNATTQNWNAGDTTYNAGLTVTVTEWGTDLGVTAALAKTLIYYSAGTRRWATQHVESQAMAKELLDRMWLLDRDAIGVSVPEVRRDYNRFDDPIFVPSNFSGVMANGDPINSSSTFISIRSGYRNDPNWPLVQSYLDGGPAPTLRYHRFWAQVDVALANAEYGRLFP